LLGLNARRPWARPLLAATGTAVAAGFLLYHAIPVKTPLSYPYWGHGQPSAGVGQWAPVIAAIAVGVWCALAATERVPRLSPSSSRTAGRSGQPSRYRGVATSRF